MKKTWWDKAKLGQNIYLIILGGFFPRSIVDVRGDFASRFFLSLLRSTPKLSTASARLLKKGFELKNSVRAASFMCRLCLVLPEVAHIWKKSLFRDSLLRVTVNFEVDNESGNQEQNLGEVLAPRFVERENEPEAIAQHLAFIIVAQKRPFIATTINWTRRTVDECRIN